VRDNSTRFKSWGLEVRVSRTVLRRASNRTYCNCRARLSNDDCTMARTSMRWQITVKNCVFGAYHAWGQASCIQSIHMPELRCVLSSGQRDDATLIERVELATA